MIGYGGMEVDLKLLITLGGMLVSVVTAAAIARQQIKTLDEELHEVKKSYHDLELRMDRNDMTTKLTEDKLSVIVGMNSPDNKERLARELEGFKKDISFLTTKISNK